MKLITAALVASFLAASVMPTFAYGYWHRHHHWHHHHHAGIVVRL